MGLGTQIHRLCPNPFAVDLRFYSRTKSGSTLVARGGRSRAISRSRAVAGRLAEEARFELPGMEEPTAGVVRRCIRLSALAPGRGAEGKGRIGRWRFAEEARFELPGMEEPIVRIVRPCV